VPGRSPAQNRSRSSGCILGAAGVVVTLAYLARQVRLANIAAQHEATREALDLNDRFLAEMGRTPQTASVFRHGLADNGGR